MGSVVFSVDAELGWGFHDLDSPPRHRIEAARSGWMTLLELMEEHDVPATWAVVGHLYLDGCDGIHADHPAPDGWFAHERSADGFDRDVRFGRDLVGAVKNATPDHEIGAHAFSHVEFGADDTSRHLARAEVASGLDAARSCGVTPTSFVFPRNNVGHRDILAAYGFTCYRGAAPDRVEHEAAGRLGPGMPRPVRKLGRALAGRPPPLVEPTVDEFGMVNLPASLFLFGFEGLPRTVVSLVRGDPIVVQAKRGIDRAAETDRLCHLWLHPNNLVHDRDVERLRSILEYVDRCRRETDLRVETMRSVAERVRTAESTPEIEPI